MNIEISLTPEQIERLKPLNDKVDADTDKENPVQSAGAILAQAHPTLGIMVCRYVPRDDVVKAYENLGIELPK